MIKMETRTIELDESGTLDFIKLRIQKVLAAIDEISGFVFDKIVITKRNHIKYAYSDTDMYWATIYYTVPDTIMLNDKEYIKEKILEKVDEEDELPDLDINLD